MHHDLRVQTRRRRIHGLLRSVFSAPWFQGRLDSVSRQVDEHLLELIGIKHQVDVRTGNNLHSQSGLESSNSLDNRVERNLAKNGWGHLGELTIRLQETIEGVGAGSNNGQPALKVLPCIGIVNGTGNLRIQTACNRLDWRE